ncbi:MAG: DUF456 family protein [Verrucomicrobiae bacterium]|nr:DUF456 family protein [Verrucomicrobiae bacterium]
METALWILAIVCVIAGIAGTVLPALPGAPLVFVGLLLAAWADHFHKVGWPTLVILGLLTILTLVAEIAATSLGAKKGGASKWAAFGAGVGLIVGMFFALPGIILGPFIGAVLGEFAVRRDWQQAGRAGTAAWLGLLAGTLAKLVLVFIMVGVFALAYVL